MVPPRRYYVVSPDCVEAVGFDDLVVAEKVAVDAGEGTFLMDTRGMSYRPALARVEGGMLCYQGLGHIDPAQSPGENLIEGIRRREPAMVRAFLAKGADPNAIDAKGAPALVWAVASGREDVVRMLLAAGADAGRADPAGVTPLALALRQGKSEIAALLRG
ncbi:MAG: ankyrin repeat domain-containing protein [Alphaproteobacteria bacterium]|nr:ankyrin repeat domain-containing protein [Alphaproteobacteria bacterium]MBF0130710.1 ankyrin repeat domain-containing protein [Alphaproteobacteria bacterium]